VSALQEQLAYLEASSPFYAERLRGVREHIHGPEDLPQLPFTTKDELREAQRTEPPFGPHLCAPRERLVRMHVTSGTTGEPVAVGFTRADHEANSAVGGEAFRIAGVRPEDTIAHCLNYALYAGGIADHMALEASGATVVPVGTGQSRRLLELIPRLGITALSGRCHSPRTWPPAHASSASTRSARAAPHSDRGRAGSRAGRGGGPRSRRRGAPSVVDTFGMSDVWSTMGGACEQGEGLHLTVGDHAILELVDPDSGSRCRSRMTRAASSSGRTSAARRRRCCATARRTWGGCGPHVRLRPDTARIRIDGRRDDMLRVQAVNVYPQAIGAILGPDARLGRHCIVADGDPVVPPLRVYVRRRPAWSSTSSRASYRTGCAPASSSPGSTRARCPWRSTRHASFTRTARGDALPDAVEALRKEIAR
jgi:phenylacetate-CoA ligase